MPRGKQSALTPKQQKAIDTWMKVGAARKAAYPLTYSVRALARKCGLPEPSVRRIVKQRRSPRSRAQAPHIAQAEILERYTTERDCRAQGGRHTKVTAGYIADQLADANGTSKFASKSRVQKAATNRADVRDPCASQTYGDRAKKSAMLADVRSHQRA